MRRRAGSVGGSRAFERSAYRRCRRRCRPMNSEGGAVPPGSANNRSGAPRESAEPPEQPRRRTDGWGIEGQQVDDEAAHLEQMRLRGHGGVDRAAGRAGDGGGLSGGGAGGGGLSAPPRCLAQPPRLSTWRAAARQSTCGEGDILRGMCCLRWWGAAARLDPRSGIARGTANPPLGAAPQAFPWPAAGGKILRI